LVKRYAEGDVPALDYLTRPWESFKPLGVSPDTTLMHMYRVREASDALLAIDDYQTNPSLELSSSGAPVSFTVDNLFEGRLQDMDSICAWMPTDPVNGMTYAGDGDATRGAVFEWPSGSPRHIEFTVPAAGRDATQWDMLSLRACQQTRHPLTIAELGDITF